MLNLVNFVSLVYIYMLWKNNIVYTFCISNLFYWRSKFQHKVCYKPNYFFLKIKTTPSHSLSTRLMTGGKFLKIYKVCKKFYTLFFLKHHVQTILPGNAFMFMYQSYKSFRDFDTVLFWRIQQIDCIFNVKLERIKRKKIKKKLRKKLKKKVKQSHVYHIKGVKRYLLILRWLKLLMLVRAKPAHNINIVLFKPILNFLLESGRDHKVTSLKLRIYKLKLLHFFR